MSRVGGGDSAWCLAVLSSSQIARRRYLDPNEIELFSDRWNAPKFAANYRHLTPSVLCLTRRFCAFLVRDGSLIRFASRVTLRAVIVSGRRQPKTRIPGHRVHESTSGVAKSRRGGSSCDRCVTEASGGVVASIRTLWHRSDGASVVIGMRSHFVPPPGYPPGTLYPAHPGPPKAEHFSMGSPVHGSPSLKLVTFVVHRFTVHPP